MYFISAIILICSCSHDRTTEGNSTGQGIDTVPMLIMHVQKCSRLYTAEYDIHKIVTHDDIIRLKGSILSKQFDIKMPVGDRKIAIPMNARLKAYIDFGNFSEQNIRRDGNRITLILPDPKVVLTGSKIDQKNIKEFVSITRSRFTDAEMADYEQQGRAAIIAAIPRMGIIETARENAARVLIPMIEQLGYHEKDITITFRKQFVDEDISILLDKNNIEKR